MKWKKVCNNREYNILLKNYKYYCHICNKRAGIFNAYCGPHSKKQNKSWKQNKLKKQYMKNVGYS